MLITAGMTTAPAPPVIGLSLILHGAWQWHLLDRQGCAPARLLGPSSYAPIMGRLARPSLVAQAVGPTGEQFCFRLAGTDQTLMALSICAWSG